MNQEPQERTPSMEEQISEVLMVLANEVKSLVDQIYAAGRPSEHDRRYCDRTEYNRRLEGRDRNVRKLCDELDQSVTKYKSQVRAVREVMHNACDHIANGNLDETSYPLLRSLLKFEF